MPNKDRSGFWAAIIALLMFVFLVFEKFFTISAHLVGQKHQLDELTKMAGGINVVNTELRLKLNDHDRRIMILEMMNNCNQTRVITNK